MRGNYVQDERVVAQKRKIGSEACNLLLFGLLLSVLVQQYVFNAPFSQYAVEFICFFGACGYILIRNILSGNHLFGTKKNSKRLIVVNSLVGGITISVITGVANYAKYGEKFAEGTLLLTLAITFISGAGVMFLGLWVIHLFNQKKQLKIEEELDEEENDLKL